MEILENLDKEIQNKEVIKPISYRQEAEDTDELKTNRYRLMFDQPPSFVRMHMMKNPIHQIDNESAPSICNNLTYQYNLAKKNPHFYTNFLKDP